MGDLSEQNRALMERILRGVLGYYPDALAAALDDPGGADLEPEDFNIILDAARSEGPSPGYDGGKSLGEVVDRLTELATDLECQSIGIALCNAYGANDGPALAADLRAALTFTASLSGGEGEGEARPEPARERRGDPCPAQPANTDDTGKEG